MNISEGMVPPAHFLSTSGFPSYGVGLNYSLNIVSKFEGMIAKLQLLSSFSDESERIGSCAQTPPAGCYFTVQMNREQNNRFLRVRARSKKVKETRRNSERVHMGCHGLVHMPAG